MLSHTIPIDPSHAPFAVTAAPGCSAIKLKQLVKVSRTQQEAAFVYCSVLRAVGLCIRRLFAPVPKKSVIC
jgi:hypothetical protein